MVIHKAPHISHLSLNAPYQYVMGEFKLPDHLQEEPYQLAKVNTGGSVDDGSTPRSSLSSNGISSCETTDRAHFGGYSSCIGQLTPNPSSNKQRSHLQYVNSETMKDAACEIGDEDDYYNDEEDEEEEDGEWSDEDHECRDDESDIGSEDSSTATASFHIAGMQGKTTSLGHKILQFVLVMIIIPIFALCISSSTGMGHPTEGFMQYFKTMVVGDTSSSSSCQCSGSGCGTTTTITTAARQDI